MCEMNKTSQGLCSTVGLALKTKTSRSAAILSMSNPHLMEINCKYEGQTELATVVSNGTRGTELGTLLAQNQ